MEDPNLHEWGKRMAGGAQKVPLKFSCTFYHLEIYQFCFPNTLWEMGIIMVLTLWGCYEE